MEVGEWSDLRRYRFIHKKIGTHSMDRSLVGPQMRLDELVKKRNIFLF
jgi:hypothetical protein